VIGVIRVIGGPFDDVEKVNDEVVVDGHYRDA
jgi:hypothetical protein